ncbi:MAG: activator of alkane oxidation [Caulobacter sp.]|nr:activator of alkane oxidation [Caulobacter sp.]
MKVSSIIAVGALAAASLIAAQASAASISPPGTSFTGVGKTQLAKSGLPTIGCNANFTGSTDAAGNASITSATFTPGSFLCSGISATGLPWSVTVTGPTTATINNVSVSASIFGTCTGNVPATISGGNITFNTTLAPNCAVQTTSPIVTTPTVSIVWP